MKKTKFFKPYIGPNKCTLKATGSGVYLIKKNDSVIYVGMSFNDVKRTMYRHFQQWNDERTTYTKNSQGFDRVSFYGENLNLFKCRVIFTNTGEQASRLEALLIKKLNPSRNKSKYYFLTKTQEYVTMNQYTSTAKNISFTDEEFFTQPLPNEKTPF